MNYFKMVVWFSIAGLTVATWLSGVAADDRQKTPPYQITQERDKKPEVAVASNSAESKKTETAVRTPVYQPPKRGAPIGRVGGGTRGPGSEVFVVSVLAPDHTGLTLSEQPSLYWFISTATSFPVELIVLDPGGIKPLLETRIPSPVQRGLHRIRLADHGIRLSTDVPYRWYVAVVPDSDRRSKDILAGGAIERVGPATELSTKLAHAGKADLPFLYAEAGLWYDALAAISELIDGSPNDSVLRKQRAALLEQVGLKGISE